jgi:hypothetical protein
VKRLDHIVQGSAEWIDARLGLPTASEFSKIITPKQMKLSTTADGYRNQLLAEWHLGYPVTNADSSFMNRGTDMEQDARAFYELRTDSEVEPGGFCLTDDERAGCSPDGWVGDDGLIEIKCLEIAKHIGFLLDGVSDEYRCQTQGQLYITGRRWVDLVCYSPVLPSVIVRCHRDEPFQAKLGPALTQFCEMLDAGKVALSRMGIVGKKGLPAQRGLELVA